MRETIALPEFMTLMQVAPGLSQFTTEHAFTPYTMNGVRGIYSWCANGNVPYMLE